MGGVRGDRWVESLRVDRHTTYTMCKTSGLDRALHRTIYTAGEMQ